MRRILLACSVLVLLAPRAYADQPEECGTLNKPFICSRAENGPSLNWPRKSATFRINDNSIPSTLSVQTVITVVRNSFTSWPDVDGAEFTFAYGGRTTQSKVGFDYRYLDENENIVIFQRNWSHDEGIIGLTTATFNAQSGEIFDADIELNSANYDFSTNDAEVSTDLQNTVTHEAGHFLGFDHADKDGSTIDTACASTATMSRRAQPGETSKRKIWFTDAIGMRSVYPKGKQAQYCSAAETPRASNSVPPTITQVSYGLGGCSANGQSWWFAVMIAFGLARWRRVASATPRASCLWAFAVIAMCLWAGAARAAEQPAACLSANPKAFMCSHISSTNDNTASLHWETGATKYKINASTIPANLDKQKVITAIQTSFSQWATASGVNLSLTYDGDSSSQVVGHNYLNEADNENLVLFQSTWPHTDRSEDKLVIALTTATYNGLTGVIYDADIELNAQYFNFTTDDVGVQTDLRNTVTHEAGHFIGFDHPDKSGSKISAACSSAACMSARAGAGETSKRTLAPTDIQGAQTVYPAAKSPQYCSPSETPKVAEFPAPAVTQVSASLRPGCGAVTPWAALAPMLLIALVRKHRRNRSAAQASAGAERLRA